MTPPAKSFGFTIGGCWYRLQCRERVTASIALLAYMSGQADAPFLGMRVMHTSNLWTGRCTWLKGEMENPLVRWAIAVDSDTSFDAGQLLSAMAAVNGRIAIGCAPVRVGGTDGICNLNLKADDESAGYRRMNGDDLRAVLTGDGNIASGGFGLAVFNLDWFRAHWPEPKPELTPPNNWVGEDIAFCQAVRRRNGRIIALPISTEHHEFKA